MNKLLTMLLCLLLPNAGNAADCSSLDVAGWMLGEWTAASERVVVREHWQRISDVTFEGTSTTIAAADGEVLNDETLRLVAMSGSVFYIAKVSQNEFPVPFRLTQCSENIAIFENPGHDAPQRLIYKRLDATQADEPGLEVRVEGGEMNGFALFFHKS